MLLLMQGWVFGYVNLGYSKLDVKYDEVEPHYYGGSTSINWSIDQTTGCLTTAYGLDLGGNSIQNVSAIMSASGNWRIGEDGKLVVQEIKTQKLEVGSQEKPEGMTIYDKATGLPKCVLVENDIVRSEPGVCGVNETSP